ncbi:MAG TPA: YncE family protein, partial [Thermoplasmata archaeon]|nr:YncE family protein [Thermoplasmata archaeon]
MDNQVLVINVAAGSYVANVSIPGGPQALAYDPVDHLLFVGSSWGSSISVIDTKNNTVIDGPIGLGNYGGSYPRPNGAVYDPLNGDIYVCSNDPFATNSVVLGASNRTVLTTNLSTGACLSMLFDPANGRVYVGGFAGSIASINGTALGGSKVPDPNGPAGLAYDVQDNLVYAANAGGNSITSFNGTTATLVNRQLDLTDTFLRASFDPFNGVTYVATPDMGFACASPGTLTVLNSSGHPQVVTSIPVGYGPDSSTVTDSDHVFVANACSDNVTVVDGATQRVILPSIPVGSFPAALAFDSLHDQVIVANENSGNLTVLNATSGSVDVSSVSVGNQPEGVAFDPKNGWIFVANYGSSTVSVINSSTDLPAVAAIPVGSYPEAALYDPSHGTVIVANSGSDNLTVINATTGSIIAPNVSAGAGPVAMALDPADGFLYVADAAGGTVAVINLTTLSIWKAFIPVNGDPQGIAYDPTTQQVDVSDFSAGTISVLATVPTVDSFHVTPNPADMGRPALVVASASEPGGAQLSYSYSGLPPGCSPSNGTVIQCTISAQGDFRPEVTATDPRGYSGWRYTNLVVEPPLNLVNASITPTVVDVGQTVRVSVSASGGAPPLNYAYLGLPPGCRDTNDDPLTCQPSAAGIYGIQVIVGDGTGLQAEFQTMTLVVNPLPTIPLFDASPAALTFGGTTTLRTLAIGGTAPLTYAYSGLPAGCVGSNASTIACTPQSNGTFQISVTVTDAVGRSVAAWTNLSVQPLYVAPPLVDGFFAGPPSMYVGNVTTFYTVVSGGLAPLRYAYSGLPGGCTSSSIP